MKSLLKTAFALAVTASLYGGPAEADSKTGRPLSGIAKCLRTTPVYFDGTIVDAAVATPQLSTLVDLVTAAGLVEALSGPGPLTVYAPTNDAFSKIPAEVLGVIGSDTSLLTSVLTYHVSPGLKDPRRRVLKEIDTLQGQTVFLKYDGGPQINQSMAECMAVRTTNGVVWIIDSVLMPQFN